MDTQSHTIFGSTKERGLTQMSLEVLFRSIGESIQRPGQVDFPLDNELLQSLQSSDPSEAQITSASAFLESIYGDLDRGRHSRAQTPMVGGGSRAQTPMMVWHPIHELPGSFPTSPPAVRGPSQLFSRLADASQDSSFSSVSGRIGAVTPAVRLLPTIPESSPKRESCSPSRLPFWNRPLSIKKAFAKMKPSKESMPPPTPRRHLPARPSALPQTPDVSSFVAEKDGSADYVVLISMYEVYNDRIFDLLYSPTPATANQMTTRQGAALQKDLRRRPLLFKSTEMSPDRKVVAGLRKVVCGSYDEAIMVLDTGLTERRVAGTGSNSVSSRSHGFFCIEVKRNIPSPYQGTGTWSGGTLSVVDLAGSERARTAKTTGSTLAEAGKINESLMYLGQCLQVQSDCQHDGSKPIVPFRQCKLTELLFSNSFPSTDSQSTAYRPQKGIMIVTADAQGDFNATSQILRYSALAREVTVPRIPSITSTILTAGYGANKQMGGNLPGGRSVPYAQQVSSEELEQAASEVARLSQECDTMAVKLAEEEIRRSEADLKAQAAEEKASLVEAEVRQECWVEMEDRLVREKKRWRDLWEAERTRGERHLQTKVMDLDRPENQQFEIYVDPDTDPISPGTFLEVMQRENEVLRNKMVALERELRGRSPTKKTLKKKGDGDAGSGLVLRENANVNLETNPFLASLRGSLEFAGGGSLIPKMGELKPSLEKGTATTRMESRMSVSPRKASLRSSHSTTTSSTAVGSEKGDRSEVGAGAEALDPSGLGRKTSVPKTPATTTGKKVRKLTTRKWDLGSEMDLAGSDGESWHDAVGSRW